MMIRTNFQHSRGNSFLWMIAASCEWCFGPGWDQSVYYNCLYMYMYMYTVHVHVRVASKYIGWCLWAWLLSVVLYYSRLLSPVLSTVWLLSLDSWQLAMCIIKRAYELPGGSWTPDLTQLCQWLQPPQTSPDHSSRDCRYQTSILLQEWHAQSGLLMKKKKKETVQSLGFQHCIKN